ncbi:VWA domain-containing protein [Allosaccharopolyspora coralli]|uniref:VWA domain-containing protein n=1 Tax=Allosaccharopolyspora coralli TaxID=2665642 RepID=A0A5Q3Q755_9PSEU|nr:substrate-binding and VWA domain-containing protein [Allosaccharopolyspora coralli]QGK69670.1 VWA domain-containing protein [Allosaccharopolyspora coralli]
MGRHHSPRYGSPWILLSMVLVGMLVAAGGITVYNVALACSTPTQIQVAAAPDIAPALVDAADELADDSGSDCYEVTVSAVDPAETTDALSSARSSTPDVWVPDSTLWLRQARDRGADVSEQGRSLATSPVVWAVSKQAAGELAPETVPSWEDIANADPAATPLGIPDPSGNAIGTAALLGLESLSRDTENPPAQFVASVRKVALNPTPGAGDAFQRSGAGEGLAAFPATEGAVVRHNSRPGTETFLASYPDVPVPNLDYPMVVLPDADDEVRDAAQRFQQALTGPEADRFFGEAGLRSADGRLIAAQPDVGGIRPEPRPVQPLPDRANVEEVLTAWAGANRSSRVQVLLDVSGSMDADVPGTDKTRMDLTLQAATQGMGLFQPTTELGVWTFSTRLDGDRDHRELLPMRAVADHFAKGSVGALQDVEPKPGGGTGLYDSVLAAYRSQLRTWDPGKANLVVVLTDGANDDPNSLTLQELSDEIRAIQDPDKPVAVIGIGVGPDIDPSELRVISETTGGESFTTPDPTKISEVFYAALSKIL